MNRIMTQSKDILIHLGLSPLEVDVYLAMTNNALSAKEIIRRTSLKRATVYYALANLEQRGLISKKNNHLDHEYILESFDVLQGLAEARRIESEKVVAEIQQTILSFAKNTSTKDIKPAVAFYEGVETVKNIISATTYCKSKTIQTIIPANSFFWNVDQKFIVEYIDRRVKHGVRTQSMWEKKIDDETFNRQYKNISNVRMMPSNMNNTFSTSIFIYDNKVMYISSLENAYCIIVTSDEHRKMMSALFDGLWSIAKPYI